jgi:branched-subunit amino acid transport protein
MNNGDLILLLAGMAAVTFGVRYPVLALLGRLRLPEGALRALRYVPPAVLTAIVVPAVLMPEGGRIDLAANAARLAGALAAAIIAWRTRSLMLTILTGMAVFLGWRLVF